MANEGVFRPNVGRKMDGATAASWMKNWQSADEKTKLDFISKFEFEFSGCDMYPDLFAVPGCTGCKTMFGLDEKGTSHFLRYPCDIDGNILNADTGNKALGDEEPPAWQFTAQCPPICN